MDVGIKLYFMMIISTIFVLITFDFSKQSIILDDQVITLDVTNLNTINELVLDKEFNQSSLSRKELIDLWLTNFITNNDINIDITLKFNVIETEPEILLVTIEGYYDFLMIKGRGTILYQSGVLVEK